MNFFLLIVIVFLVGCSSPKQNNLRFFEDYENTRGWLSVQLENGFAYSGKYAQKVSTENEYSQGFLLSLAETDIQPLKKIKTKVRIASAQIDGDIFLVIDIFSPSANKSIAYNSGKNWGSEIKKNKAWAPCSNEMEIPATARANDIVKVYVWNPKHQQFFMDDFEVIFEK